jgi:MerC mercury resistance protein
MHKSSFDASRADRRGMLLASLCFVHCVAGPILLSYAGFSSLIGVSEKLEPLFLLGSGAMGILAFVPAYRKKHGRKSCLALFAFGLLCLLLRRYIELPFISAEPVVTGLGASLIVGAHLLNLRFSKRCQCCGSLSETIHEATHASERSVSAPQVQIQPDGQPGFSYPQDHRKE